MRIPLNSTQFMVLLVLGVILWFLAAILLRVMAPVGIYEDTGRLLLYGLIIPGTVPFIWLTKKIAKLADNQVALGMAVVTGAAILLDGIALAWFPALYGTNVMQFAGAGAAILWGGGVALFLGMLMNKADAS